MSFIDKEIKAEFKGTIVDKTTLGHIIIREYDEKERSRKMLQAGIKFGVAAIFSIFIPILHFILVPGFIIGGVIAVNIIGRPAQIHGGKAKCPECDKDFEVSKGKPEFPKEDYCSHCRRKVIINKVIINAIS